MLVSVFGACVSHLANSVVLETLLGSILSLLKNRGHPGVFFIHATIWIVKFTFNQTF